MPDWVKINAETEAMTDDQVFEELQRGMGGMANLDPKAKTALVAKQRAWRKGRAAEQLARVDVKSSVEASGMLAPGIAPGGKYAWRPDLTEDLQPNNSPELIRNRIASLERRLAKLKKDGFGTQEDENAEDMLTKEIKALQTKLRDYPVKASAVNVPADVLKTPPEKREVKAGLTGPTLMELQNFFDKQRSIGQSVQEATREVEKAFGVTRVVVNSHGSIAYYKPAAGDYSSPAQLPGGAYAKVGVWEMARKLGREWFRSQPESVQKKLDWGINPPESERAKAGSGLSSLETDQFRESWIRGVMEERAKKIDSWWPNEGHASPTLPGGAYAAAKPTQDEVKKLADKISAETGWGSMIRWKGFDDGTAIIFFPGHVVSADIKTGKWFKGSATSSSASQLPGGAYAAEQAADGSWTVRDVPIFAQHEVPLADGKRTAKVDAAWLQDAVKKARERESGDKYLAPVHVRHHGGGQPTEPAGFFRPTRVGQMQYEGREVAVLFADLVGVPDATYQEMKLGRLPYRSVEVHDIGKPEVNSLALLQDEVPFFRLPMLTIGAEKPSQITSVAACAKYAPLEAFAECGAVSGAYLYSEASMRKYAVPTSMLPGDVEARIDVLKKKLAKLKGSGKVEEEDELSAEIRELENRMKGSAMPDTDKKPDEDAVKAAADPDLTEEVKAADEPVLEEDINLAAEPSSIDAKLDQLIAMLTKFCGGDSAEVASPADAPPAGTPASLAAQANMDARVTALSGQVSKLTRERDTEKLVAGAMSEIKGYAVGDDIATSIRKYAAQGAAAVKIYVDAIKGVALKDPPDKADAGDAALPAAISEYSAQGPEIAERAAKYAAEHAAQGGRTSMDVKRYVAARFASEPMTAQHS